MKIIVVHNYYQQPGGEDAAFAQERELLERAGHEVISYCRDNGEVSGYSRFKQLGLLKQIVWAKDTQREIGSLLLRERPHLGVTTHAAPTSKYGASAKRGMYQRQLGRSSHAHNT